jgi:hypothetical protein
MLAGANQFLGSSIGGAVMQMIQPVQMRDEGLVHTLEILFAGSQVMGVFSPGQSSLATTWS